MALTGILLVHDDSSASEAWRLLGVACHDRIAVASASPLAGVAAGLRAARTDLCVVVPANRPLLTAGALWVLASECLDAAVPLDGALPAVFRRSVLPLLDERIAWGQRRLADALAGLEIAEVELPAGVRA